VEHVLDLVLGALVQVPDLVLGVLEDILGVVQEF